MEAIQLYTSAQPHPDHSYARWRESVRERMTDLGFSEWVQYMIDNPEEDVEDDQENWGPTSLPPEDDIWFVLLDPGEAQPSAD